MIRRTRITLTDTSAPGTILTMDDYGTAFRVRLASPGSSVSFRWRLWPHTVHEFESIAAGLEMIISEDAALTKVVPTPDSFIGITIPVHLATSHEIGYNLNDPWQPRASIFLWRLRSGVYCYVKIGPIRGPGLTCATLLLAEDTIEQWQEWLRAVIARASPLVEPKREAFLDEMEQE